MGITFIESDMEPVVAALNRHNIFAFDIETTGLSPLDSRPLLVQVGVSEHQYVIDVAKTNIEPLLPFLRSRKWKKIFFNGKFDEQFMIKFYHTPVLNVFDCYIAERVIAPESKWGNSFEDLVLLYLKVQLDKKVRQSFYGKKSSEFTEEQIKYAAEDVEYLFPLWELQAKKLKDLNMEHIADLEFDLVTVISNMELEGVPVNPAMWRERLEEYRIEHKETKKKTLSAITGVQDFDQQIGFFEEGEEMLAGKKTLNLGSPIQLKKAFKDYLGINLPDTKEQTISNIDHPAAKALGEYRKLDKIMTSYGENFIDKIHPFTGRIHPNWKQVGTETGRFSCAEPNMQQIPEKFRACVGGAKDYMILGADFSQMELRILAEESKDPILVDAFVTGKDVHAVTASTMFNIPIEEVTKEQRFTAKTLNFGITYGMKVKKFVDMMNGEAIKEGRPTITVKQGSALLNKYKETYKVASNYLESVGRQALREGRTQTRFGRKRFFQPVSTKMNPDAYRGQIAAIMRQGANMPIQGTNADITKMAMIQIHEELKEYGFKAAIILQVHDEIVLLAHKSQIKTITPIVEAAMIQAGQRLLPTIPVVVDTYVSEYWPK